MLPAPRFDQPTWQRHLGALGLDPPQDLLQQTFQRLHEAYSNSSRHYHDTHHIVDCLEQLQASWAHAHAPAEVAIAFWYHDAVYESRRPDNEEQSADLAREALKRLGASARQQEHIAWLVLCTRHHKEPLTPPEHPQLPADALVQDSLLLNDIDLSILGRTEQVFNEYDQAIRREFAWVEEERYRQGRTQVLEAFLKRQTLYHTSIFAQRFDAPARANLTRMLALYESGERPIDTQESLAQ